MPPSLPSSPKLKPQATLPCAPLPPNTTACSATTCTSALRKSMPPPRASLPNSNRHSPSPKPTSKPSTARNCRRPCWKSKPNPACAAPSSTARWSVSASTSPAAARHFSPPCSCLPSPPASPAAATSSSAPRRPSPMPPSMPPASAASNTSTPSAARKPSPP